MKKTKLSIGLVSCLLSVGALAGCDNKVKSSNNGVLLTYTVDGVEGETQIRADELLGEYYDDSTKYQAIFDTIYSVIAKNYFTKDRGTGKLGKDPEHPAVEVQLGKPQMKTIERDAEQKVKADETTAESNADSNNTSYKKEFEAILESKGVESREELLEKYIEELQKETFENNFYTYMIEDIKMGKDDVKVSEKQFWTGYLNDMSPYHVSHILIELDDSSDTNYYNGTISETNVKNLYNAINELGLGEQSFAKIATNYSKDPGSKDKKGDLGIMDYDTSFINEFKLGIYAYEQFYKGTDVSKSRIDASDFASDYDKIVSETFGIGSGDLPTVPFSKIAELKQYAAIENDGVDGNGKPVMEGSTLVYPRNVIYNKYLNRHAIFFITDTSEHGNFKDAFGTGDYVLCADGDEAKPIIAVRASSGDKNEIHLMVVNRSPFDGAGDAKVLNGVSLQDYYTIYYPAQNDFYPVNAEGKQLNTYVNFLNNDVNENKTRAEEFASKIKSYDSEKLSKYIFLKYMQEENVKILDEKLNKALMKWIETSVTKKSEESKETWTKTWNEYLDKLRRQNSEREKLVSELAVKCFEYGNDKVMTIKGAVGKDWEDLTSEQQNDVKNCPLAEADPKSYYENTTIADAFKKEGGLFNDGKEHF